MGVTREAIVPKKDLGLLGEEAVGGLAAGDEVSVYVMTPEDRTGNDLVSLNRAQQVRDTLNELSGHLRYSPAGHLSLSSGQSQWLTEGHHHLWPVQPPQSREELLCPSETNGQDGRRYYVGNLIISGGGGRIT
jgi:hypothetical protein